MTFHFLALSIFMFFVSCNQPRKHKGIVSGKITENKADKIADKDFVFKADYKDGMVISCGSGCAMQYNVKQIEGNESKMKVEFSVQMFEDEKETDHYFEDYFFFYNKENKLLKIIRNGETESFLETQMPNSQREFKNFAQRLITEVNKQTKKLQ
ncbi:MAG: hypothetical protein ABIP95_00595 [Pelobium sp.]